MTSKAMHEESFLSSWVREDGKEKEARRLDAFEETANRILRYLEDSEDLKMGVTELQEQQGISEEAGISIKQIAQQAMNENGQDFWARRRICTHCQQGQMERAVERFGWIEKRCQNEMQEVK